MAIIRRKTKPTKIATLDELRPLIASGQPVLLDFYQANCGPCRTMDGVIKELADDYRDSAHIVKIDIAQVPGAAESFGIRSTPTFVLLGNANRPASRKQERKKRKTEGQQANAKKQNSLAPRWRAQGLVKKDQLAKVLESNGATPAS